MINFPQRRKGAKAKPKLPPTADENMRNRLFEVKRRWLKFRRAPVVVLFGIVLAGTLSAQPASVSRSIDLAGQWRFALDRTDAGVNQQWFSNNLPGRIKLPGVLQSQYYGDE